MKGVLYYSLWKVYERSAVQYTPSDTDEKKKMNSIRTDGQLGKNFDVCPGLRVVKSIWDLEMNVCIRFHGRTFITVMCVNKIKG